ncbi:hypothetical protein [Chitinophaga sp. sic0106]|uniref:hypothetical protein n=1 Tax=Chitinophaga sp. sic0106 TaxID=2854785 RepID=UPI001C4467AD|nr:hypothetical protein [Chitinophaga sp. sic0106]MBV7532717.1 hypothetical protein [Chitinophaga sp. sic0106]
MNTARTISSRQPLPIGAILQRVNWLEMEEVAEEKGKIVALPATPQEPEKPVLPPAARKDINKRIRHCVKALERNYDLYLGYLELELEDAAARQEADLTDDMKFSLAYYAWQLHHAAS